MTLLSSGFSLLQPSVVYYYIDVKPESYQFWFKIYGMHSILAYMMYNTMDLSSLWH